MCCPLPVPNDDPVTKVTHVVTSLVLTFIVWHLHWSGCRFVTLREQQAGAFNAKRFGDKFLKKMGFSQDSFFIPQKADGLLTDFSNNLSKRESKNKLQRCSSSQPCCFIPFKRHLAHQNSSKSASKRRYSANPDHRPCLLNSHLDETLYYIESRFQNRLLPLGNIRYF